MIRATLFCIVTASFAHAAAAQRLTGAAEYADSARREIEAASIAGDSVRLQAAETLIDRALTAFPNDALLLHYQGYAFYRMAGIKLGTGDPKSVGRLLERAEASFEKSTARKRMPETSALLSSVHGQMIAAGANPFRTMRLGMHSGAEMNAAFKASPTNPRVVMLRGVNAIFTPKMWGGGLDKAEADLLKAATLFVNDSAAAPLPSWGRAEVYAWLGQVYQMQKRTEDARKAYQRALAIEPGYAWVRNALLPSLSGTK